MAEKRDKRSRWKRRAGIGLAITAVATGGIWYGIHNIPGFGPALADGARAVLGPSFVAWLEDTAYGIADRVNVWRYGDAPPATFWDTPSATPVAALPAPPTPSPESAAAAPPGPANKDSFPPPAFEPPFPKVASPGDGTWFAMAEGAREGEPPVMVKAVVHPDPKRSFAAVAVVAIDLKRIALRLVAGTTEPVSNVVPLDQRPGLIPGADQAHVIAAFNGGFKALHGQYGMMIGGKTFLPPRDIACTVGLYRDGSIRIRTWPALKGSEADMAAYRQTPPCLVEEGELNEKLSDAAKGWGATVSGETIIRRSAVGIDAGGHTLFYGFGEAVTAQSLGKAMKAVGAQGAAQLDVNYAYPRFLLFDHPAGAQRRITGSLVPHVEYRSQDYVVEPSPRDFFYLMRRHTES